MYSSNLWISVSVFRTFTFEVVTGMFRSAHCFITLYLAFFCFSFWEGSLDAFSGFHFVYLQFLVISLYVFPLVALPLQQMFVVRHTTRRPVRSLASSQFCLPFPAPHMIGESHHVKCPWYFKGVSMMEYGCAGQGVRIWLERDSWADRASTSMTEEVKCLHRALRSLALFLCFIKEWGRKDALECVWQVIERQYDRNNEK